MSKVDVNKVTDIVAEQLNVEKDEVTLEASFVEDLGADSLDQVELVMRLEEEFGIEIPDEDACVVPRAEQPPASIEEVEHLDRCRVAGEPVRDLAVGQAHDADAVIGEGQRQAACAGVEAECCDVVVRCVQHVWSGLRGAQVPH